MLYRIYGERLRAELPIAELAAAEEGGDDPKAIRFFRSSEPPPAAPAWFHELCDRPGAPPWLSFAREGGGYLLRFHGLANFRVTAGGDAIEALATSVPDETLHHLLLDHVLPLALTRRGRASLHATAVLTARGACAFVGESGSGKSTLAAAFARAGHAVVCDDCLTLVETPAGFAVHEGYPGVRLGAASLAAVLPESTTLPVAHYTAKRRVRADDAAPRGPHPLARVYLLAPAGEHVAVEPVAARAAFEALLAATFRLDLDDRGALAREFAQLGALAARVPVRRLVVPRTFAALDGAREAVLADLDR